MPQKDLKPFHESCIDSLQIIENALLNQRKKIGPVKFIVRYREKAELFLDEISRTIIPPEHLMATMIKLNNSSRLFLENHQGDIISASSLTEKREDKLIYEAFESTIQNLAERMCGFLGSEKEGGLTYYQFSIQIVNIFMMTGKPFLLEQVQQVILFFGGILRADITLPIKDYLESLREGEILSKEGAWYQATAKVLQ